jgi:hypothetical protein
MLRISFCKNSGKLKEISSVVVKPDYNEIITTAKNKLRLKINESKIRLFVAKTTFTASVGDELTIENTPSILINDTIICVSEGEDFMLSKDIKNNNCALICPFSFTHKNHQITSVQQYQSTQSTQCMQDNFTNLNQQYDMNGDYPILDGNILKHFKDIVKDNNKTFVQVDCGDYYAFDYNSATANDFPNLSLFKDKKEKWMASLKREMRGIIICAHTGKVLARRFHKFFNINECDETNENNIQLHDGFVLTKKIDGSLVSPFLLNSKIVFATRTQIRNDIDIYDNNFVEYCIHANLTPLYEYCECDHLVGIIQHTQNSLTLLSIRNNISGEYFTYNDMIALASKYNVKCVENIVITGGLSDIVLTIRNINLIEGFVLMNKQQLYKIKTDWYTSIAYSLKQGGNKNTCFLLELVKKRPIISDIPIYKIYQTILSDNADDYIAQCCGLLDANERKILLGIKEKFLTAIDVLYNAILTWINDITESYTKDIITQSMINANFSYQFIHACLCVDFDSKTIFLNNIKDLCTAIYYKELQDILELNNNDIIHVYCDLDGVLVDFDNGVKDLTGRYPKDYSNPGHMWANIEKINDFWTKLKFMSNGKELFDYLISQKNKLYTEILTGLPDGKFKIISDKDKKKWCQNNLGDIVVNTCMGRDKYTYCKKNFVLIDDREEYGINWQKKGGIFIHHTDTKNTIEQLENILRGKSISIKQKVYDCSFKDKKLNILASGKYIDILNKIIKGENIMNLVIIMRGVPGCGKTTFCNYIYNSQQEGNVVKCSADHYFNTIGKYDKNLITTAHDYCKDEFITAIKLKTNIIIIDNTNIMKKNFEYYVKMGLEDGREIMFIEFNTYEIVDDFYSRNVHGVALSKIKLMKRNFDMIQDDNVIRILTK